MNFKERSSKRTALFWAFAQRAVVILTDVSVQHIGPIFQGQELPL